MKVLDSIAGSEIPGRTVLTLGNFDGCHLGHQALIRRARQEAEALKCASLVVTFRPHPREFFDPSTKVDAIFTPFQKIQAFKEMGLDYLLFQSFDRTFSELTAEFFVFEFLIAQLGAICIIIGDNFRFGYKRQGDVDLLRMLASQLDVKIVVPESVKACGQVVSSTRLRDGIRNGRVSEVAEMLGRPYCLTGKVSRGRSLGAKLGVPTANLLGLHQVLPQRGVYAGYVSLNPSPSVLQVDHESHPAVINVGCRPTVSEQSEVVVEGHILSPGFAESLYERNVSFYFLERIRPEVKFASLRALKKQIVDDIATAKKILA